MSRANSKPPVYLVKAGEVVSASDGDVHFISTKDLLKLYGLRVQDPVWMMWTELNERDFPDAIVLEPRYDGDYHLPTQVIGRPHRPPAFANVAEADAWMDRYGDPDGP